VLDERIRQNDRRWHTRANLFAFHQQLVQS
jgi:hypothetical protein